MRLPVGWYYIMKQADYQQETGEFWEYFGGNRKKPADTSFFVFFSLALDVNICYNFNYYKAAALGVQPAEEEGEIDYGFIWLTSQAGTSQSAPH